MTVIPSTSKCQYHNGQRFRGALDAYLGKSLDDLIAPSTLQQQEAHLLSLFQSTYRNVFAYRHTVEQLGIIASHVNTLATFKELPVLTKENYLQAFPLEQLCPNDNLLYNDFIAVSSGSTGQPTFWPRFPSDELQITPRFEQIFHDSFYADQRSTLAVVCFALGTWIGGMFTTNCCRYLAAKGYSIVTVTPGNNKAEILRVVDELGAQFDQVVLLGYPPFLKDVVDTGIQQGIDWPSLKTKLVMAGEVFNESWRDIMADRLGAEDICTTFASMYGTADAGVLGNETPLSISIRRFLAGKPELAKTLFGEHRLPTLVQYDPLSRYFESIDGQLVFSGQNGIPLVRYNILDHGGIVPFEEMMAFLKQNGFVCSNLQSYRMRELPFVYVFGRTHFAVSYFGANIYPENIALGLEQPSIKDWVTGKFILEAKPDIHQNMGLHVTIECAPTVELFHVDPDVIAKTILAQMRLVNPEFFHYVPEAYQTVRIHLKPSGDPEDFPVGVKHRYTRH